MPILCKVCQNQVPQEGPNVITHWRVEGKLWIDHLSGICGHHDGTSMEISVNQSLGALNKPAVQNSHKKHNIRSTNQSA